MTENKESGSWHGSKLFFTDMNKSFDSPGDEMYCNGDKCRVKVVHAVGSVSKVKWIDQGGHPFTGLFKGGEAGIARFSSAAANDPLEPGMAPAIGLKLLRDGVDSGNFVAMNSLDEQGSFDFFERDFYTHIESSSLPPVIKVAVAAKFATASANYLSVGLSDFASYTETGEQEYPVIFPFKLRLHPVYDLPRATLDLDYKEQLKEVPAGSTLYEIYA